MKSVLNDIFVYDHDRSAFNSQIAWLAYTDSISLFDIISQWNKPEDIFVVPKGTRIFCTLCSKRIKTTTYCKGNVRAHSNCMHIVDKIINRNVHTNVKLSIHDVVSTLSVYGMANRGLICSNGTSIELWAFYRKLHLSHMNGFNDLCEITKMKGEDTSCDCCNFDADYTDGGLEYCSHCLDSSARFKGRLLAIYTLLKEFVVADIGITICETVVDIYNDVPR